MEVNTSQVTYFNGGKHLTERLLSQTPFRFTVYISPTAAVKIKINTSQTDFKDVTVFPK